MYALKWAYLLWVGNISLTVRSREGTFVVHGQIWKKIIFCCFWYDCFILWQVNYITFKERYEFKTSVLNIVCGEPSWVSWVWCYRGMVPSWIFHVSTTFSRLYFMGPKLFLVGVLWDQNIFLSVLFQIDFNNCKLCLYWIGTTSAKLFMLLRSFIFCYNLGQYISHKL